MFKEILSEPVNETGLVKQIVKAVEKQYPKAWIFKVHGNPMQRAGVPDLLISVEGRLIAAEVKFNRPGESVFFTRNRASERQLAQIEKLQDSGAVSGVVISIEETMDLIATALEDL